MEVGKQVTSRVFLIKSKKFNYWDFTFAIKNKIIIINKFVLINLSLYDIQIIIFKPNPYFKLKPLIIKVKILDKQMII